MSSTRTEITPADSGIQAARADARSEREQRSIAHVLGTPELQAAIPADQLQIGDVVTVPTISEHNGDLDPLHDLPFIVTGLARTMMGDIQLKLQDSMRSEALSRLQKKGDFRWTAADFDEAFPVDDRDGHTCHYDVSEVVKLSRMDGGLRND